MQIHGLGTHNNEQFLLIAHPIVPQIPHKLFGPSVQLGYFEKSSYTTSEVRGYNHYIKSNICKIYSYIFLNPGDTVHLIVGNHNHSYVALGGIWILGGIGSLGDIALDPRAIAGQVSNVSEGFFSFIYLKSTQYKKLVPNALRFTY